MFPIPILYRWLAGAALIVLGALALVAWDTARIKRAEARGDTRARAELKAQADAQTDRNRELQRAAETRYTVQAGVREEFIGYTIKEIRHVAAPLASCALPADAIRLLRNAAACANSDTPSTCSTGQPVRSAP